ncbi:MAG TPA: gamma-glutamyl-gamma-aminobutyrate hydrolase family protein [Trebonia sp.]|jgi:putative glutamine amidotransferase|nr:gamma-glutamyl-gamma-aminobutyrate hydrolase family protein [Trebonia sp.]
MRPLIGIVGRRATKSSVLRFSGTIASETLLDAVLRAGGEPVILHGGSPGDMAGLPERVARFDGLVLPGGGDLNPGRYSATRSPNCEIPDDQQDAFDLAVIRAALGTATPTLAICRGLQVLNVACGGTLRQHIVGGPVEHEGALHPVTLAAGSRLRQLAGADTVEVSSAHHQSVDRLGAGLHAVGCAPDGCLEAIEHTSAGILAVQWHPEDQAATRAYDQAIFDDLLIRAGSRAALATG